jgi:nucleotide-binding universal stress UspA family protein
MPATLVRQCVGRSVEVAMRSCLMVLAGAFALLPGWSHAAPVARVATAHIATAHIATAQIATDTEPPAYTQAASQEQIIAAVEKRYNAKVVRVTETTVAGRPALRLRLLSAQRVWSVVVDAATGQELAGG